MDNCIKEIRKERRELEDEISQKLREFQESHGISVTSVNILRYYMDNKLYDIEIKLTI